MYQPRNFPHNYNRFTMSSVNPQGNKFGHYHPGYKVMQQNTNNRPVPMEVEVLCKQIINHILTQNAPEHRLQLIDKLTELMTFKKFQHIAPLLLLNM